MSFLLTAISSQLAVVALVNTDCRITAYLRGRWRLIYSHHASGLVLVVGLIPFAVFIGLDYDNLIFIFVVAEGLLEVEVHR